MRKLFSFRRLFLVLVVVFSCSTAFCYQFSPLEQHFEVSGAGSIRTYTIVNDSDDSIALTISALIRDQDEGGGEVNKDAASYFSIQPSKVIVKPFSSQIIRVQYRGPKTVTNELSFRIKAEQIAYNKGRQSSEAGMFNFLYNYITSAYVSPAKSIAKVSVTGIKPVSGEENLLAVTLSNQGTVHQVLVGAKLKISDGKGKVVTLEGKEQLGNLVGMNILAKKQVTLTIPMPEGLSLKGSYQGEITYAN